MKNEQIVLDRVLAHLKDQKWERSRNMEGDGCKNRDIHGRKCAVACLLDDSELDKCGESLVGTATVTASKFCVSMDFIDAIRRAYDTGTNPAIMKFNFLQIAAGHGLDARGI